YNLVSGRRRLQAHAKMGRKTVPCRIGPFSKITAELAEIDENIIRNNLTVMEEQIALARRKSIYLELHPETARGVSGANAKHDSATGNLHVAETPSFAADT